MKNNKKVKVFKILIAILTITILVISTIHMFPLMKKLNTAEGQIEFKEKIASSPLIGILLIIALEFSQIFLAILPGEPIEILAGICYGSIYGTLIILVSIIISSATIVFLVKKLGKNFIFEFIPKEKVDDFEKKQLEKNEKKIELLIMTLFLIPGTPKDILIYIGALLPIENTKFIIMSTILRLPSIISSTFAGKNLIEGNWKISVLAYVVSFLISFLLIFINNKLDKNKKEENKKQ